jgi:predicted HicB family RNase H-like nuclease
MMEYKGYMGMVNYDAEAKIFHGDVINTRDVITFQGTSVKEIEKSFRDSVDDYLEWCGKEGQEPEKPYSGKFNLRISPELHREAAVASARMNLSLNRFVEKALMDELSRMK